MPNNFTMLGWSKLLKNNQIQVENHNYNSKFNYIWQKKTAKFTSSKLLLEEISFDLIRRIRFLESKILNCFFKNSITTE